LKKVTRWDDFPENVKGYTNVGVRGPLAFGGKFFDFPEFLSH